MSLWFAEDVCEKALLQRYLMGGDVGVEAEGVDEAPQDIVYPEASCCGSRRLLVKTLLQRCLAKALSQRCSVKGHSV